jgi:hypothetical protein
MALMVLILGVLMILGVAVTMGAVSLLVVVMSMIVMRYLFIVFASIVTQDKANPSLQMTHILAGHSHSPSLSVMSKLKIGVGGHLLRVVFLPIVMPRSLMFLLLGLLLIM